MQSILITSAIIGKLKAWTYVGLVALFSTLAGLTYGAWRDGTSALLLGVAVAAFIPLLSSALHVIENPLQGLTKLSSPALMIKILGTGAPNATAWSNHLGEAAEPASPPISRHVSQMEQIIAYPIAATGAGRR